MIFNGKKYLGFRLLTEYYSFLCKVYSLETIRLGKCVSVSLRSIIHSYFKSWRAYLYRYRLGLVSVSLRSIIHSYKLVKNSAFGGYYLAFPSPYGVLFILMKVEKIIIMQEVECFRLLTEYHSFLLKFKKGTIEVKLLEFPSPYGVSFILIR